MQETKHTFNNILFLQGRFYRSIQKRTKLLKMIFQRILENKLANLLKEQLNNKTKLKKIDIVCEEQIGIIDNQDSILMNLLLGYYTKRNKNIEYIHFFEHQTPIMRSILFDWISEVCKEFTLKRETLHLCIHIIDRYMQIYKQELQLLGLARNLSQASNYSFTEQQIIKKEQHMLTQLQWLINPPTLYLWSTWYLYLTSFVHIASTFIALFDCVILDITLYQFQEERLLHLFFIWFYLNNLVKAHTKEQLKISSKKRSFRFSTHLQTVY
ncbi:unnamed protein product [Paramecium octaurelia]|uniref:Cyclin-like domain-containing protein n=1 Tax=Paramecium octaurelia TaxID=43137 RepID=A0A8S1UP66_PAROT|nr:unnamed protein product [Paramecium octaurelia]